MTFSSGFEVLVSNYLRSKHVKFTYEPTYYGYEKSVRNHFCRDCGSDAVCRHGWYLPDFVLANGIVLEAKGYLNNQGRTKLLAVLDTSEYITRDNFRILFMRDNWLDKKTKATAYSDWCRQKNITFAINKDGVVPEEWLQ